MNEMSSLLLGLLVGGMCGGSLMFLLGCAFGRLSGQASIIGQVIKDVGGLKQGENLHGYFDIGIGVDGDDDDGDEEPIEPLIDQYRVPTN